MDNLNRAVRKEGALRGLLFGVIMLVVDILKLYYLAFFPGSPVVTFIVLYPLFYIVLFGVALLFISGLRKKIGRYWSLKQATTGIFIMLIITSLVWNNGVTLFAGYINPAVAEKAHTSLVETRKQAMQSMHAPAKKIQEEVAGMNQKFAEGSNVTIKTFFQSLVVSVILVFAVSVVLGALFKREGASQAQS